MVSWKKNPFCQKQNKPRKTRNSKLCTVEPELRHQEKGNATKTNATNNNNKQQDIEDTPLNLRLKQKVKKKREERDSVIAKKYNVTLKDARIVLNDIGPFIVSKDGFYGVHGHEGLRNIILKENVVKKEGSIERDKVLDARVNTVRLVRNTRSKGRATLESCDSILPPGKISSTKPLGDVSFSKKHSPIRLPNADHLQPATSSKAAKHVAVESLSPKKNEIKQQDPGNRVKREDNKGNKNVLPKVSIERNNGKRSDENWEKTTLGAVEKSLESDSRDSLKTNEYYNYQTIENDTNSWKLPNIIVSLNSQDQSIIPRERNIGSIESRKRTFNNHRLTERNAPAVETPAKTVNATNINREKRSSKNGSVNEETKVGRILPKIIDCKIVSKATAEKKGSTVHEDWVENFSTSNSSSTNFCVTSTHGEKKRPVVHDTRIDVTQSADCTTKRSETQHDVPSSETLGTDIANIKYRFQTNTRHQEQRKDTIYPKKHETGVDRKAVEVGGKAFMSQNHLKSHATDFGKTTHNSNAINYEKTQAKCRTAPMQFLNAENDLRSAIGNKRNRLSEKYVKSNVTDEHTKNREKSSKSHSPIRTPENTVSISSNYLSGTSSLQQNRKITQGTIKLDSRIRDGNCERIENRNSQEILSNSDCKVSSSHKRSKKLEITNDKVKSVKRVLYESGFGDSPEESRNKIAKLSVEEEEKRGALNEEKVSRENSSQVHEKSPPEESTCTTTVALSDDDCISLFADSFGELEQSENHRDKGIELIRPTDNEPEKDSSSDESFGMRGSVYERYATRQKHEFNKVYEENLESNQAIEVSGKKNDQLADVQNVPGAPLVQLPRFVQTAKWVQQSTPQPENINFNKCFHGYCFYYLRFGLCNKHTCVYRHQVVELTQKLSYFELDDFIRCFDYVLTSRYFFFAKEVYKQLKRNMDPELILKLFMRLYDNACMENVIVTETIEILMKKNLTIQQIVSHIKPHVHMCDATFVVVFISLKEYIPRGELWNIMKNIFWRLPNPNIQILQTIISECVYFRPEHVNDIQKFLLARVHTSLQRLLDADLMTRFRNLLQTPIAQDDKNNMVRQARKGTTESRVTTNLPRSLDSTAATCNPSEDHNQNNNNEQSTRFNNYTASKSFTCNGTAEELYNNLTIVNQALAQGDYYRALNALENVPSIEPASAIPLLYHQTVFTNQKLATKHLTGLFSLTARENVKSVTREILKNVAQYELVALLDEGLYVLAKSLLKSLMIFEPELDAAKVMLHAEVYLANQEVVKAFSLLKRYNMICENPDKWKVPSTKEDQKTRVTLLTILLDALSGTNPKYALHLFKMLIVDQSSNYSPVDLMRSIDKMVSIILSTKDSKMIIDIGKLLCFYNISLRSITYRALIATLVSIHVPLAAQIYRRALATRVYSSPKFYPVTHLVVNTLWTKEEMSFIFQEFFRKIMLNIGHVLDHVRPQNLAVFMVLENISPLEKEFVDKEYNRTDEGEFQRCETMIRRVLIDFNPSIKVSKKSIKVMKIQSGTLLNYFKAIFNG